MMAGKGVIRPEESCSSLAPRRLRTLRIGLVQDGQLQACRRRKGTRDSISVLLPCGTCVQHSGHYAYVSVSDFDRCLDGFLPVMAAILLHFLLLVRPCEAERMQNTSRCQSRHTLAIHRLISILTQPKCPQRSMRLADDRPTTHFGSRPKCKKTKKWKPGVRRFGPIAGAVALPSRMRTTILGTCRRCSRRACSSAKLAEQHSHLCLQRPRYRSPAQSVRRAA